MKRMALSLTLIIITGCVRGEIQIRNDRFRKETVITLELSHRAEESGFNAIKARYIRKIKDGNRLPTAIRYTIYADPDYDKLADKMYIQIDEKYHELTIGSSDQRTDTRIASIANYTFPDYYGRVMYYTTVYPDNRIVLKGTVILSAELEGELLKAQKVLFRMYAGDDPLTIVLSESERKRIKEFLLIDPGKIDTSAVQK
jgi:hypothetical protein